MCLYVFLAIGFKTVEQMYVFKLFDPNTLKNDMCCVAFSSLLTPTDKVLVFVSDGRAAFVPDGRTMWVCVSFSLLNWVSVKRIIGTLSSLTRLNLSASKHSVGYLLDNPFPILCPNWKKSTHQVTQVLHLIPCLRVRGLQRHDIYVFLKILFHRL